MLDVSRNALTQARADIHAASDAPTLRLAMVGVADALEALLAVPADDRKIFATVHAEVRPALISIYIDGVLQMSKPHLK